MTQQGAGRAATARAGAGGTSTEVETATLPDGRTIRYFTRPPERPDLGGRGADPRAPR